MGIQWDFEKAWLAKLMAALDSAVGDDVRTQIMQGSEALSAQATPEVVADWTCAMLERMASLLDMRTAQTVMTGCACQYSKQNLQPIRHAYERNQDVSGAHRMLQANFETFLSDTLEMNEEMVAEVVGRGWGVAGLHQGDTIIATKIPKSGNLASYLREPGRGRKRHLYCHCPRIRHVVSASGQVPRLYCYCGAGFYKGIWEEILQRPVEVEVLETVLDGGEVCKIAVHLSPNV